MLGQALAYAPNVNVGIISTGRLLELFKRIPKIENPARNPYNSADVSFFICPVEHNFNEKYPFRKSKEILNTTTLSSNIQLERILQFFKDFHSTFKKVKLWL